MSLAHQHIKFTALLALAIAALPFSVIVCHYALIAFGLMWVVDCHWKEKWSNLKANPLVLTFIFFFLLHLVGIIYSANKQAAWYTIEKKITLLVLPVLLASIKLDKVEVRQLLHVFVIACLSATFVCLGTALYKVYLTSPTIHLASYSNHSFYSFQTEPPRLWMFISYRALASGIRIHPAYLSLYIIFCIALLMHFYADSFVTFTRARKIGALLTLFYLVTFVLFLSSRISILALLTISLYGLHKFLKSSPRLNFWASSLACVVLFSSIIYFNPVSRFRSYEEMATTWPYLKSGLQSQSTTIRASLWWLSFQSLPTINWLVGAGTGDVENLISQAGESANITNVLKTNDPHNQYLQTLLGLGILGLITLLVCLAWPAWVAYKIGNHIYVGFIFLFSILCLTETAMEMQKGIVFYTLFGSLILFLYKPVAVISYKPAAV